jgi:hypothetical protein
MLLGQLADDPARFGVDMFARLHRQCQDAVKGHGDGGVGYLHIPF